MNYDLMWKTIGSTDLEAQLADLSDEELKLVCATFVDARTELMDAIVASGRSSSASEDLLSDVAESVIREGREAYELCYSGEKMLPPRKQWSELEKGNISGILGRTLRTRLKRDLLSVFEELVGRSL